MIISIKELGNIAESINIKVVDNIRTKGPLLEKATITFKFKENSITFNKCDLTKCLIEYNGFVIPALTIYKVSRSLPVNIMETVEFDIISDLTRKNLLYRCDTVLEMSVEDYMLKLIDIERVDMTHIVKMEEAGLLTEKEVNEINQRAVELMMTK